MEASPDSSVAYGVCTASDVDEMARLLGEVFAERDPPAVAAGVTASEFEAFVRLFCPSAGRDALTIVARDAQTGRMIGALLTEDSASAMPEGLERLSPAFEPVFDLLGQLDEEYRDGREPRPGDSLHLFLLGVARQAAGRGIAQRLVAECLANGAKRGYRTAVTEATNLTSRHIFQKLGFVERVRRSYADHRHEGRAVFASIAEHGGPVLMDKNPIP